MVYRRVNGFYQWITTTYGNYNTNLLKSWLNTKKKICTTRQQLIFLVRCRKFDLIPPHINNLKINLQFYSNSVNKKFVNKLASFKCSMLNIEIKDLNFNLNFLRKSIQSIEQKLFEALPKELVYQFFKFNKNKISYFNYNKRIDLIRKFDNLVKKSKINLNPLMNIDKSKWLVNVSNKIIPENVKDILSLGDSFGLPLDNREHKDRTTSVLEIVKNIEGNHNKIPSTVMDNTRNNIANSIEKFLSKSRHINHIDRYFIGGYSACQRFLQKNKDLHVTKADKSQITVVMNKNEYVEKMYATLSDVTTYKKIKKDPINGITTKIKNLVKSWRDNKLIDDGIYKKLNCTNANLPRCYGLPKIHKENAPLRIIVSSLGSPAYNVAYFIHKTLYNTIEKPKSHIKDGWSFANTINNKTINDNDILISLDVSSLFTNIPKNLVITAIEKRWTDIEKNTNFNLNQFIYAIETVLDSTSFSFNGEFFEQIFGSPMGSPLSPIIADMVMDDLETCCLEKLNFKVSFYVRYVDDIFAIIPRDKIDTMVNIFNSYHERLKFTYELENNNKISFLNTTVLRKDKILITDWYQKPTFSGRYINYLSNHPHQYKINTIINLVDHAILLSNDLFHNKNIELVKQILTNNCYPSELVNQTIKKRINYLKWNNNNIERHKTNDKRQKNNDAAKYINLPYIKNLTDNLKHSLSKVGLKVVHSVPKKLNSLIRRGKDKIPKLKKTEVVYQIKCKNCEFSYIGQTKRHLNTRIKEHKNNIKLHESNHSVISKHRVEFKHEFDWENPNILHNERHTKKRELAEMFFIKKVNNTLNAQKDTDNLNSIYDKVIRIV